MTVEIVAIISLILGVAGLILGFQKDLIRARVGKSIVCFTFLLVNWLVIYVRVYGYVSDVWKWYPAVICIGILTVCLLIIWEPLNDKMVRATTFSFAGAMVVLTVAISLLGTYNGSFFEELESVTLWPFHLASLIVALIVFLCFRKNQVAKKIGKSLLCALILAVVWLIATEVLFRRTDPYYDWVIAIVCIGVYLICLLFIWKLFNVKIRRVTAICLAALIIITSGCIVGFNVYEDSENSRLETRLSQSEEIDLTAYEPFRKNTLAKDLDEPSVLRFQGNLPRLDGATALYPLYAAFARATYPEVEYDVYDQQSGIVCSRTSGAFNNLLDGSADLIFLMGVSDDQREQAKNLGLELKITPIGKEAFVFFVNKLNPVSNLTVKNVQDIYSGQIKNWSYFGGGDNRISAYQRPETSGSQVMLKEIMGDIPIVNVPKNEIFDEMMGMYKAVAKGYRNSLGYSFLFYINDMIAENKIKFLSIDGVEPTTANIANDTYPFAHDFYAITVVREPETEDDAERIQNTEKLIEWILSSQGQGLVEKTGYVPLP